MCDFELTRIIKKYVGAMWAGLNWLRAETSGGIFEHGNET
jgi:hypothetical protein